MYIRENGHCYRNVMGNELHGCYKTAMENGQCYKTGMENEQW